MTALDTTMIKTIASNENVTGRKLYKGQTSFIPRGKLMINTNNVPGIPGDDTACWDRLSLIPWDTRYVVSEKEVDRSKWLLPSDPTKKAHIESLTSAFMTVGLNELTAFYAESLVDGVPTVLMFPVPKCVTTTTDARRVDKFPLMMFAKHHLLPTKDFPKFANVEQVYNAFISFLHRRRKSTRVDRDQFHHQLAKLGHDVVDIDDDQFVINRRLSDAAVEMSMEEFGMNGSSCMVPRNYAVHPPKGIEDFLRGQAEHLEEYGGAQPQDWSDEAGGDDEPPLTRSNARFFVLSDTDDEGPPLKRSKTVHADLDKVGD